MIPISVFIDTWNITYSGADILYSDKIRQHLAGHLLCTDNDKDIWVHSITQRFLADVQTVAQNVTVDDDSLIRKLAVMLTKLCMQVPVRGTSILIQHNTHTTVAKKGRA